MSEPIRLTVTVKRRYFWRNWDNETLSPHLTWQWEVSVLELGLHIHEEDQGKNLDDLLDDVGDAVKSIMISRFDSTPEEGFVLVIGGVG